MAIKTYYLYGTVSGGGRTDTIIRGISPAVQKQLVCTVIIENRRGGNGVVGTVRHKLNDPADGSVICHAVGLFHSAGGVRSGQYTFDDFDYLAYIVKDPSALVVHVDSEYQTIYDLIEAIKSNPAKIRWGMQANAAASVGVWIMNEELGLNVREIPYEGGGPMRAAFANFRPNAGPKMAEKNSHEMF
ncbi:MAG: tripartite tricarboxylate transporter substrate-binding protein [Pseudomonadota bacterium]